MKSFKFFQRVPKDVTRRYESNYLGQLQWMELPVGVIFYVDRTHYDDGSYTDEVNSTTFTVTNRMITSYDDFMVNNMDNLIYVYQFVDNSDLNNLIYYNQDNFDEMPRHSRLIFRGTIRNNDYF